MGNVIKIQYPDVWYEDDSGSGTYTPEVLFEYYATSDVRYGKLKKMISQNGLEIEYEYGTNNSDLTTYGRLIKIIVDPYHETLNPDGENRITEYTYDELGRITQIHSYVEDGSNQPDDTKPQNRVEYEYDISDNIINTKMHGDDGYYQEVKFAYDIYDHLESISRPFTDYEDDGVPTAGTARTLTEKYTYDLYGKITSIEDSLGRITELAYNVKGRPETTTDAKYNEKEYAYNSRDLLTKVTEEDDLFNQQQYDENGNLTKLIDKDGQETTYKYDGFNRLKEIEYPPDENLVRTTEQFWYDELNRIATRKTRTNDFIHFQYDALGRLTSEYTLAAGGNSPIDDGDTGSSEPTGTWTHVTGSGGNGDDYRTTTSGTYEFSAATLSGAYAIYLYVPNVTGIAMDATYTFMEDSTPIATLTPADMTLDAWNLLYVHEFTTAVSNKVVITSGTGTTVADAVRFVPATNYYYTKSGAVSRVQHGQDSTEFTYDKFNQVQIVSDIFGKQMGYDYDNLDRRTQLTYPSEGYTFAVDYEYDNLNRLRAIKLGGVDLATYTYDDLNRRNEVFYFSGAKMVYDYEDDYVDDDLGADIEGVYNEWDSGTKNIDITYYRDNVGNIVDRRNHNRTNSTSDRYDYDALYQLQSVYYDHNPALGEPPSQSTSALEVIYNFDNLGNRTTVSFDGVNDTYSRPAGNKLNQYSSAVINAVTRTITYDLNGNMTFFGDMTQVGDKSFTYDYQSRMTSISVIMPGFSSYTEDYTYDSFGRRVSKYDGTTTTTYVYDGSQVIAEYEDTGDGSVLARRFIYGPGIDEPICMINYLSSEAYFYHYDGQGDVIGLSEFAVNGNMVEMYEYDIYGQVTVYTSAGTDGIWLSGDETPASATTIGNPYYFTGRRYDAGTGLYYYRARMYSPDLGRFMQTDPIGYADGMNMYAYCGNNPVNRIDPWGLCTKETKGTYENPVPMSPAAFERGRNFMIHFITKEPLHDMLFHEIYNKVNFNYNRDLFYDKSWRWFPVNWDSIFHQYKDSYYNYEGDSDFGKRGESNPVKGSEANYYPMGMLMAKSLLVEFEVYLGIYYWKKVNHDRDKETYPIPEPTPNELYFAIKGYEEMLSLLLIQDQMDYILSARGMMMK